MKCNLILFLGWGSCRSIYEDKSPQNKDDNFSVFNLPPIVCLITFRGDILIWSEHFLFSIYLVDFLYRSPPLSTDFYSISQRTLERPSRISTADAEIEPATYQWANASPRKKMVFTKFSNLGSVITVYFFFFFHPIGSWVFSFDFF